MTTGALIFAFNNEKTDYVGMAEWCAKNVRRHLDIPVAVVTDCDDISRLGSFDKVIKAVPSSGGSRYFEDYQTHATWYNAGRTDAYSVTPWDQTLVLDSDFVVNSPAMKHLFELDKDFLCHRHSFDITNPDGSFMPTFGKHNFPMWWATVMLFRKSNTAQYIFDCMHMIRENWQHYRDLYGIYPDTYRNDFALSIALGIVSGHTNSVDAIPWNMPATLPEHQLSAAGNRELRIWEVKYKNAENKLNTFGFAGQDFHAMGKRDLGVIIEQDH